MICKKVDGYYRCEAESQLFYLLRDFDIGHRYHFPLIAAKSVVVLFCLFLTTHVHNDVSKQFLLAVCAPVVAEVAMNIVVNVLYLVDYFPNLDTVTTVMRLQRTFEIVIGDIFVLASCTYMVVNLREMKTGQRLGKATHIGIFQALVAGGSIVAVLLTLTQKELSRYSTYYLLYHIIVILTSFLILTMTGRVILKRKKCEEDVYLRSRDGLVLSTAVTIPLAGVLLAYPYFEELLRLCLKLAPLVFLPATVLLLPAFRNLFLCCSSLSVHKSIHVTPGWTENQYRIEKTPQGVYMILPPCSQQTRVPLKSQLPDYSKLPYR